MDAKHPTVDDMHYLDFIGDNTVGCNCPILNRENKMKGVLSNRFNWSFIYDIIDLARISTEGDLYLVNRNGLVIGSKKGRMFSIGHWRTFRQQEKPLRECRMALR